MTATLPIDGHPAGEFEGSFEAGGDLNRALIERRGGDCPNFEVPSIGGPAPGGVICVESHGVIPHDAPA